MATARDVQERLSQRVVEDLERSIDQLGRRVKTLEDSIEAIRALGEQFWHNEAAAYLVATAVTSWSYDARDPASLFDNVFPPEDKDGRPKRWVRSSGTLEATIAISRARPLVFTAEVSNFAIPELADTLVLTVDDNRLDLQNIEPQIWSAYIPQRAGVPKLKFSLSVQQDLIPEDKDVSFAFRSLAVALA